MTNRHQRGRLKKERRSQLKLECCSFVQFGHLTVRERTENRIPPTGPAAAERPIESGIVPPRNSVSSPEQLLLCGRSSNDHSRRSEGAGHPEQEFKRQQWSRLAQQVVWPLKLKEQ